MFPATTWISQHVSSAHYCWWSSALILHGIPEVGTSYIYRNIYHTGLWIHFEPKPPLESSSSSSSSSGNENLFAFFSIILAAVRRSYSSVKPECQYCHFSLALCQGARGRKTADSNSKCQPFDNLWKKRRIWCSLHSNHRAGAYLREKYGGIFASPPPPPHPRRPSILTFSRLILRRGSILRGRRRCQSHSLQGDPASNDCHIRTSGETARTHAPPTARFYSP